MDEPATDVSNDLETIDTPGSGKSNQAAQADKTTTDVTNRVAEIELPGLERRNQTREVDKTATDVVNGGGLGIPLRPRTVVIVAIVAVAGYLLYRSLRSDLSPSQGGSLAEEQNEEETTESDANIPISGPTRVDGGLQ